MSVSSPFSESLPTMAPHAGIPVFPPLAATELTFELVFPKLIGDALSCQCWGDWDPRLPP